MFKLKTFFNINTRNFIYYSVVSGDHKYIDNNENILFSKSDWLRLKIRILYPSLITKYYNGIFNVPSSYAKHNFMIHLTLSRWTIPMYELRRGRVTRFERDTILHIKYVSRVSHII